MRNYEPIEPEINDVALEWATRHLFLEITNHGDLSAKQFHHLKDVARETVTAYLKEAESIRRISADNSILTD